MISACKMGYDHVTTLYLVDMIMLSVHVRWAVIRACQLRYDHVISACHVGINHVISICQLAV